MINLRSKITQKVLSYFFLHPDSELYLNELARLLKVDRGNLTRKLKELEKDGVLSSTFKGNQHYYFTNQNYPFFEEYKSIVQKSFGIEYKLKNIFSKIKGIKNVFIFGSYAQNKMEAQSDIDVLVVGSSSHLSILYSISELQSEIQREINIIDFDEKEYQSRIDRKDPFLMDILSKKMIKLI